MAEDTQVQAQTEVLADWRRQLDASTSPYDARVALGVNYKEDGSDLPGGPYQPADEDLTSLADAETNNAIYYRSADDTWEPVTIGTGVTFEDGTLSSSGLTTGDAKLTFKTEADDGWVMMVDGAIGNASSGANTRANADTQPLFELLFGNVSDAGAPLFTSTGLPRSRADFGGATACFNANTQMYLPRQLGQMLTGVAFGGSVGETTNSVAGGSALGRTFWNIMIKL